LSSGATSRIGRPADLNKRSAIVEAAARRFFDQGFAAASIEQIARDAKVSKVTIYNHFGDKRGLFAAAVEHECEKIKSAFALELGARENLRQLLHRIGENFLRFMRRPELVRFDRRVAAEAESDPDIGRAFLEAGPYRVRAAFAQLLADLARSGRLRLDDPELVAEQFISLCKGIGDLERRYGVEPDPRDEHRRIAAATEIFLKVYAVPLD